jgi:hypothetical protein
MPITLGRGPFSGSNDKAIIWPSLECKFDPSTEGRYHQAMIEFADKLDRTQIEPRLAKCICSDMSPSTDMPSLAGEGTPFFCSDQGRLPPEFARALCKRT